MKTGLDSSCGIPEMSRRCTGDVRRARASSVYGSRTSPATASSKLPKSSRSSNSCNCGLPSDVNRERLPAPHGRGEGELGLLHIHGPFGKALQNLLQRDTTFEARQRCSEAEVDPETESEVPDRLPVYVEDVWVLPAPLVAIRRTHE